MFIGLWLLLIAAFLIGLSYLAYKRNAKRLFNLKEEDLVSYYLELAIRLLPVPFWTFILGILVFAIGLALILIRLFRGLFF